MVFLGVWRKIQNAAKRIVIGVTRRKSRKDGTKAALLPSAAQGGAAENPLFLPPHVHH